MDSEENTFSPADYLYQGLPELLPEYDSLLMQLVALHLTVWQVIHDQDQAMSASLVEVWVKMLRRIPTKPANPLEELSRQAPAEQNDEIEEFSSDDELQPQQQEQQENPEDQAQEGDAENPVDVDRNRDSPQFCIIDSHRIFDHPASAGFLYRRASGQQSRVGERRGPYLRRGRRKTGFKQ